MRKGRREITPPPFILKKPERIMALALIMVLCLLVYRVAERRLRA